jgi:protoheme IX farnesyltransferase
LTPFAKLAIAAAAATFVLITVGGLVRATDSGLGCPDWPLCFGDWIPPAELHAWIEHSHRLVAAVFVGPLVAAIGLITLFSRRRRDRVLLAAAVVAGVLVIVQSLLGALVVLERLRAELVTAHLGMALVVFGTTIVIAERSVRGPFSDRPGRPGRPGLTRLVGLTAVVLFAQMLLGATVTGRGAGLAFADFPLMDGALIPAIRDEAQQLHFAHRALAVVLAILVGLTAWAVFRRTDDRSSRRLALLAVGLVAVQIALGGANVVSRLQALFVVPHLAVGAALWAVLVLLYLDVRRLAPARATVGSGDPSPARRMVDTARAYVALTKPRIIELLLVTTIPTMVLAQGGVPSVWLMTAVVIGGTLAAAGANTINQVIDRDIDDLMRRTRRRPLPSHLITPRAAVIFGVTLSIGSFAWLWATVNLLSALLAASAIAFYVFVYTLWLKRSTPQNIVIGGAAGCVPVLVAWAAVTGRVEVPALVLFAIVFYWTPPHFWALALRYRSDYASANVPMLPVVRGEAETARQIVLYSIVLVGASLLLWPAAGMGIVYVAAAIALGGAFLGYALRLRRAAGSGRAAIGLFRYSISYLTLLFGAVAVDSLIR